jgi:hypothetical protein
MAETIQEKTVRLANAHLLRDGEVAPAVDECIDDPDFKLYCKFVAIVQAEALEEAATLHSFGEGVVDKGDLLNMARDLRESVK